MKYVERCLSPSRGRDVATDVKQPSHRELRGEREREREMAETAAKVAAFYTGLS